MSAVAVLALIERLLTGGSSHFDLRLSPNASSDASKCFTVADAADGTGRIVIEAPDASTLSAGVGFYLRERCNVTIGWPRGGGSAGVQVPPSWPTMAAAGGTVSSCRRVEWSYFMNVVSHSYSFAWYGWEEWEQLLDWMSLHGINNFLALTGQEEIAYRVFTSFGLSDPDVRGWFNGPGFLAWSRGQNEYGAGIAGPLPRSFMKAQYKLQTRILARARTLGMVGQLPGFQGNVPIQLKQVLRDANISQMSGCNQAGCNLTGWMDSLDPVFAKISRAWMEELLASFGTDHWYQLDGYFNGGTAPWLAAGERSNQMAPVSSPVPIADPTWHRRGVAAYRGLNASDPDAVWSFQGFAWEAWAQTPERAAAVEGFISAAPPGKFVIIDMDGNADKRRASQPNGSGQWRRWDGAAFWGAPFIWTALHNFGGNTALQGNLTYAAGIPTEAMEPHASTHIVGTGFTMEGIDQNPAYYDLILNGHFDRGPTAATNLSQYMIERAHRRYRLTMPSVSVAAAWALMVETVYQHEPSVHDLTGVSHLPGTSPWPFADDRVTPTIEMCKVWRAWGHMIEGAESAVHVRGAPSASLPEPLRYDLINLGREVLAQLSTPLSQNFADALDMPSLDAKRLNATAAAYVDVLIDIDTLVGTDQAFLLGSWLQMARRLAAPDDDDCTGSTPTARVPSAVRDCAHFYEYNARCQITTWHPTPEGAHTLPSGPLDYANKEWAGLIKDYYATRVELILAQALADEAKGGPLDKAAVERVQAQHAFRFQVAQTKYPTEPVGDPISTSRALHAKHAPSFKACA